MSSKLIQRRAVIDYFRAFFTKNMFTPYGFLVVFYLLVMPLNFLDAEGMSKAAETAGFFVYYSGAVPLILGLIGIRLSPVRLPKEMYLCPLEGWQRKTYAMTIFWVRFLAPAGLFLLLRELTWFLYPMPAIYFLADVSFLMTMLGSTALTVTGSVTVMEADANQPPVYRDKRVSKMPMQGLLIMVIGLVIWVLFSGSAAEEYMNPTKAPVWGWALLGAAVLWQIWLFTKIIRQVPDLLEIVCDYERMGDSV